VIADLETIRREVQFLRVMKAKVSEAHIQEWEKAIEDCAKEVRKYFFLTNRIFIRQTLAQIQQELILVTARDNLDGIWIALKRKLESIDEDGKQTSAVRKLVQEAEDFFESKEHPEELETSVRRHLRAIRKFIDDGLLLDLASAYSLKRSAEMLVVYLLVIGTAILVFLFNSTPSPIEKTMHWSPSQVIGLALFGALGGTISAIVRPTPGKDSGGLNLLTRFSFMRVVLGSVSGLLLFLLFSSGIVQVQLPYLGVCALAMAFGFSERALIGALSTTASRIDMEITRATGQLSAAAKAGSSGGKRSKNTSTGKTTSSTG